MTAIPISEFEHRVAKWVAHLEKTREPLEVSQRGRAKLVVLDKRTFDEWVQDRERMQALEIKLLVEEGTRSFARGKWLSHEAVGRRLRKPGPKKRRE